MQELKVKILEVTRKKHPMVVIYGICRLLGQPQERSTNKFYVRVYRACEQLVDEGKMDVMRGTRDPSVYLNRENLKI